MPYDAARMPDNAIFMLRHHVKLGKQARQSQASCSEQTTIQSFGTLEKSPLLNGLGQAPQGFYFRVQGIPCMTWRHGANDAQYKIAGPVFIAVFCHGGNVKF
jgi:hypothetical protein